MKFILLTLILVMLFSGCVEPLKSAGQHAGTDLKNVGGEVVEMINNSLQERIEPQELIDGFCISKKMDAGKQLVKQTLSPSIICYIRLEKTNEYSTTEYSWNEYYVWKELNTVQTKTIPQT